jgi:hypothetical protein
MPPTYHWRTDHPTLFIYSCVTLERSDTERSCGSTGGQPSVHWIVDKPTLLPKVLQVSAATGWRVGARYISAISAILFHPSVFSTFSALNSPNKVDTQMDAIQLDQLFVFNYSCALVFDVFRCARVF